MAGNLTLHENAELSVGQNPKTAGEDGLTVGGNASIGKNASVEVGGDFTLTGSAESGAPTFSMGEGSKITAGGKFAAGSSQIVSATDDDADKTLQGFITAPEGIDFSAASGSDGGTGDPLLLPSTRPTFTVFTTSPPSPSPARARGRHFQTSPSRHPLHPHRVPPDPSDPHLDNRSSPSANSLS